MQVGEVMHRDLIKVRENTTVSELVKVMSTHALVALPAVDQEDKLVGIVTERDILLRVTPKSVMVRSFLKALALNTDHWLEHYYPELAKLHGQTAADLMTKEVITVDETAPLEKAAELLIEHDVRQLAALREGVLVGLICRYDIVKALAPVNSRSRCKTEAL